MKKDNRSVIQTLTLIFSVWNQYAGADFFMQYTGSVAGKSDRDLTG